ncbi:MAG: hypothetical protein HY056_05525 [Proteobacteria bacterium]|nr:hypothetical protein [Pseudomonadota bacterium]
MTQSNQSARRDWAGGRRDYLRAWGLPVAAIVAGAFVDAPARAAIWALALGWMGTACLLNARRCGRTHCRYTGPFYLVMILPVVAAGSGIVAMGAYGWFALAAGILVGGKLIWWASERAWGKFS